MDSGHGKMRMDEEQDRLSILPDDLIYKILSLLRTTDAIDMSVLSSRWRFIWTSIPYLNFSTEDFSTLQDFSKFVTHVLSGRNNLIEVYSMKLTFGGKASQAFVKRTLNYAFSHNLQKLNVVWLIDNDMEFPLSLLTSQSLKHLSLTMQYGSACGCRRNNSYFSSTWELPSLTTLDLYKVTLHDDNADNCIGVFSKCENLKNLTLKHFNTTGSNGFSIYHPRLSNLTLEDSYCDNMKVVNVVAPQLKHLTIRSYNKMHVVISAPDLTALFYKGARPLYLSTDGFHSLEKADICVSYPQDLDARQIVCILQQLHNVHLLTLNLEIVELLSSSTEHLIHQPSFVNLKSLKIYPYKEYWSELAPMKVAMSTELKSYLLDRSPRSTFTIVLREEIKAQEIMAELRVILEKEKDDAKTNTAHPELWKTQAESHKPKKLKIGGNMAQIKSCWENLGFETERMKEKVCLIISSCRALKNY